LIALGTAKLASNKIMKEEKGIVAEISSVLYYRRDFLEN